MKKFVFKKFIFALAVMSIFFACKGPQQVEDLMLFQAEVEPVPGGVISLEQSRFAVGSTVKVTVTPDKGMKLTEGSLQYSIEGKPSVKINEGNKRFSMPASSIVVQAAFESEEEIGIDVEEFSFAGYAQVPVQYYGTFVETPYWESSDPRVFEVTEGFEQSLLPRIEAREGGEAELIVIRDGYSASAKITVSPYSFKTELLDSGGVRAGVLGFSDHTAMKSEKIEMLDIPQYINGNVVCGVSNSAFENLQIYGLKLPETLESVGEFSFADTEISVVELPANVTSVGDGAFRGAPVSTLTIKNPTPTQMELTSDAFDDTLETIFVPFEGRGDYRFSEDLNDFTKLVVAEGGHYGKIILDENVTSAGHSINFYAGSQLSEPVTNANFGERVLIQAAPARGFVVKEGSVAVRTMSGDAIKVTNNVFDMPNSNVIVTATFVMDGGNFKYELTGPGVRGDDEMRTVYTAVDQWGTISVGAITEYKVNEMPVKGRVVTVGSHTNYELDGTVRVFDETNGTELKVLKDDKGVSFYGPIVGENPENTILKMKASFKWKSDTLYVLLSKTKRVEISKPKARNSLFVSVASDLVAKDGSSFDFVSDQAGYVFDGLWSADYRRQYFDRNMQPRSERWFPSDTISSDFTESNGYYATVTKNTLVPKFVPTSYKLTFLMGSPDGKDGLNHDTDSLGTITVKYKSNVMDSLANPGAGNASAYLPTYYPYGDYVFAGFYFVDPGDVTTGREPRSEVMMYDKSGVCVLSNEDKIWKIANDTDLIGKWVPNSVVLRFHSNFPETDPTFAASEAGNSKNKYSGFVSAIEGVVALANVDQTLPAVGISLVSRVSHTTYIYSGSGDSGTLSEKVDSVYIQNPFYRLKGFTLSPEYKEGDVFYYVPNEAGTDVVVGSVSVTEESGTIKSMARKLSIELLRIPGAENKFKKQLDLYAHWEFLPTEIKVGSEYEHDEETRTITMKGETLENRVYIWQGAELPMASKAGESNVYAVLGKAGTVHDWVGVNSSPLAVRYVDSNKHGDDDKRNGDVTLYIPKGVTLRLEGGQLGKYPNGNLNDLGFKAYDAEKNFGAGAAAFHLPSGARLRLIGYGTLEVKGGRPYVPIAAARDLPVHGDGGTWEDWINHDGGQNQKKINDGFAPVVDIFDADGDGFPLRSDKNNQSAKNYMETLDQFFRYYRYRLSRPDRMASPGRMVNGLALPPFENTLLYSGSPGQTNRRNSGGWGVGLSKEHGGTFGGRGGRGLGGWGAGIGGHGGRGGIESGFGGVAVEKGGADHTVENEIYAASTYGGSNGVKVPIFGSGDFDDKNVDRSLYSERGKKGSSGEPGGNAGTLTVDDGVSVLAIVGDGAFDEIYVYDYQSLPVIGGKNEPTKVTAEGYTDKVYAKAFPVVEDGPLVVKITDVIKGGGQGYGLNWGGGHRDAPGSSGGGGGGQGGFGAPIGGGGGGGGSGGGGAKAPRIGTTLAGSKAHGEEGIGGNLISGSGASLSDHYYFDGRSGKSIGYGASGGEGGTTQKLDGRTRVYAHEDCTAKGGKGGDGGKAGTTGVTTWNSSGMFRVKIFDNAEREYNTEAAISYFKDFNKRAGG